MRLQNLHVSGLRAFEDVSQPLAPVTVLTGPNGSGKTTLIGGLLYCLTGRFPGITGATAQDLVPLMRALPRNEDGAARRRSKPSFSVTLHGATRVGDQDVQIAMQRGITFSGDSPKHKLDVRQDFPDHRVATTGKAAEQDLVPLFGDVQWMADLFDARRTFWNESPERRMSWAFGLCAESAGDRWTRQAVDARVQRGAPVDRDDFDPALGETVAQMLEQNVQRLHQRVLAAQKVAREARRVADTITAPTFPPTEEEVRVADRAVREAHERYARAAASLADSDARMAAFRSAQQDVERLQRKLDDARQASAAAAPPPQPPQAPVFDQPAIDRLLRELEAIDFDLAEGDGEAEDPRVTALEGVASEARALLRRVGDSRSWTLDLAAAIERLNQLPPPASPLARRRAVEEQIDALRAPTARHRMAMDQYEAAAADFARRVATAGEMADAMRQDLVRAQVVVDAGPPARDEQDLAGPRQALDAAERKQQELRSIATLAREQTEQLRAAERADARVQALKDLHGRAVDVQADMMADGLAPLTNALRRLPVPVAGGEWVVSPDHLLALRRDGIELPFGVLSEGERFRGSIALLIAVSMVRQQPWRALLLDGFERVSEDARVAVIETLVRGVSAGLIDNAIIGCAAPVPPVDGALVVALGPEGA